MKRLPIILMATGWLLYVASFFLPVFTFMSITLHGWELAVPEFPADSKQALYDALYEVAFLGFNAPMFWAPWCLFSRRARFWKVLPHLMLGASVLIIGLLLYDALSTSEGGLLVGVYLWCASYVLVTCSLYLNRRARLRASHADPALPV